MAVIQPPIRVNIFGKDFSEEDRDKLCNLLWLLQDAPGEWDYRYFCKEGCDYNCGILYNHRPCQRCGGEMQQYDGVPCKMIHGWNRWITRKEIKQAIEVLTNLGLKSMPPNHNISRATRHF